MRERARERERATLLATNRLVLRITDAPHTRHEQANRGGDGGESQTQETRIRYLDQELEVGVVALGRATHALLLVLVKQVNALDERTTTNQSASGPDMMRRWAQSTMRDARCAMHDVHDARYHFVVSAGLRERGEARRTTSGSCLSPIKQPGSNPSRARELPYNIPRLRAPVSSLLFVGAAVVAVCANALLYRIERWKWVCVVPKNDCKLDPLAIYLPSIYLSIYITDDGKDYSLTRSSVLRRARVTHTKCIILETKAQRRTCNDQGDDDDDDDD